MRPNCCSLGKMNLYFIIIFNVGDEDLSDERTPTYDNVYNIIVVTFCVGKLS